MHALTLQRSLFEQNRVALGKTFPGAKTSLQMHWAQGHAEPEVFVYPAQWGGKQGCPAVPSRIGVPLGCRPLH